MMAEPRRFSRIYWIGSIAIIATLCLSVVFMVVASLSDLIDARIWELVGLIIVGSLWFGSITLTTRYWRQYRVLLQAKRDGRAIAKDDLQVSFNRAFMATLRSIAKTFFLTCVIAFFLSAYNKDIQLFLRDHPLIFYLLLLDGFVILAALHAMQFPWEQEFRRE